MECSLWLNRKKINSAAQISDNLDIASLRGYFLAGSLIEWLNDHNGAEYAEKLSKLSHSDPQLNNKISAVFGGEILPSKALNGADCSVSSSVSSASASVSSSYNLQSSANSSVSSFEFSSYEKASSFAAYVLSSGGSFNFGSFSWLSELLKNYSAGSFSFGSFVKSSFSEWEWEWLFRMLKNVQGGSFSSMSSFPLFTSSFDFSRFEFALMNVNFGSFTDWKSLGIDEYDYIMFKTLMICPLDRFGYGIHII